MTRLTATTFVSLDGVMQGPGGPEEDTRGGFPYGGWVFPYADESMDAYVEEVFDQADGFLLGRTTYEIFASFWPRVTDPRNPIASRLNALPKHVVSTTMERAGWGPAQVISADVEAEIARLKERPGRELQIHGSGALIRSLLDSGLIDTFRLLVFPVYLGRGRRLWPEGRQPAAFEPAEGRVLGSGITALTLRPKGPVPFGSFTLEDEQARGTA